MSSGFLCKNFMALISKRLKLQMPDWSQIKAYQIFFNLRAIWQMWLLESFFRSIFALLEAECHRFLISNLA